MFRVIALSAGGALLLIVLIVGLPWYASLPDSQRLYVMTEGAAIVAVAILAFIAWGLPAIIAYQMGRVRSVGKEAGLVLGLFFSWLGVFVLLLYPETGQRVRCPYCRERILKGASVCRYCRAPIDSGTTG